MNRLLLPLLVLGLAACSGADADSDAASARDSADVAAVEPMPGADTTGPVMPPPPGEISDVSGQPAIPETVDDPNWKSRYSPDVPYYNRTGMPVPITEGPSPRTALVGQMEPDDAGFIQTCELNSTYCKITFGGEGQAGYVNIELLSGEAH